MFENFPESFKTGFRFGAWVSVSVIGWLAMVVSHWVESSLFWVIAMVFFFCFGKAFIMWNSLTDKVDSVVDEHEETFLGVS